MGGGPQQPGFWSGLWQGATGGSPEQPPAPVYDPSQDAASNLIKAAVSDPNLHQALSLAMSAGSQVPGTPGINPNLVFGGLPSGSQLATAGGTPTPVPQTSFPNVGQPLAGAPPQITAQGPQSMALKPVPQITPFHNWLTPQYDPATGKSLENWSLPHKILADALLASRAGRGVQEALMNRYYAPWEHQMSQVQAENARQQALFGQASQQSNFELEKQRTQAETGQRSQTIAQGLVGLNQRQQSIDLERTNIQEGERQFQDQYGMSIARFQGEIARMMMEYQKFGLEQAKFDFDKMRTTNPVFNQGLNSLVQKQRYVNQMQAIIDAGPDKWNAQTASQFASLTKAAGLDSVYQANLLSKGLQGPLDTVAGRVPYGLAAAYSKTLPQYVNPSTQLVMEQLLGGATPKAPKGAPQVQAPGGLTPR